MEIQRFHGVTENKHSGTTLHIDNQVNNSVTYAATLCKCNSEELIPYFQRENNT